MGRKEWREFHIGKSTNTWMNLVERPETNKASLRYFREYKQCQTELGRNQTILFFLVVKLGIEDLRTVFESGRKQKTYIRAMKESLKRHGVTQEWYSVFDKDIEGLHRRCDHVLLIIKANLKLTPLYPYFENGGFDRLMEYGNRAFEEETASAALEEEINTWNAEHADLIAKHMEDTEEERQNLMKHRAKIKAEEKAEKQARKDARKAENAEVKEMMHNQRYWKKRRAKIEREFAQYYH